MNRGIWLPFVQKVTQMHWKIQYRTLFSKASIGSLDHFTRYRRHLARLAFTNRFLVCQSHTRIILGGSFCICAFSHYFRYSCSGCGVPRCHCNYLILHKGYFKETLCSPGHKCFICSTSKTDISRQKFRDICSNGNVSHIALLLRTFLTV